jgi:hypothetical protein
MRRMAIAHKRFPGPGWERFPRNLPTTPARTLQLPEGREPICQQGAAAAPSTPSANVTNRAPVSPEVRNNNQGIIDLCAPGLLEGGSI